MPVLLGPSPAPTTRKMRVVQLRRPGAGLDVVGEAEGDEPGERAVRLAGLLGEPALPGGAGVAVEDERLDGREETAEAGEGVVHRGRLVAAVDHALLTLGVAGGAAEVAPLGRVEELLE